MPILVPCYRDSAQLPGPLPELHEIETAIVNAYLNPRSRAEYVVVVRELYVVRYGHSLRK